MGVVKEVNIHPSSGIIFFFFTKNTHYLTRILTATVRDARSRSLTDNIEKKQEISISKMSRHSGLIEIKKYNNLRIKIVARNFTRQHAI